MILTEMIFSGIFSENQLSSKYRYMIMQDIFKSSRGDYVGDQQSFSEIFDCDVLIYYGSFDRA